jgi:hypothetical protein
MPPMRSISGLATALTILFALVALVDLAASAVHFRRAGLIGDLLENPLSVSLQDMTDADDQVAAATGLHVLGLLVIGVTLIIWQWRHAKNAEVLGARGGLGPGWAIGGWFIPLANFVLPGVQMFQSSKGSDVDARRAGRPPKGAWIIVPWAIGLGLGALLLAGSQAGLESDDQGNVVIESVEDIEEAQSSDQTAGAGFAIFAITALLGLGLVRTLTGRQRAAYAALAASALVNPGAPPPPAPYGAPTPPPPPPHGAPPPPPPGAPPQGPGDFTAPT